MVFLFVVLIVAVATANEVARNEPYYPYIGIGFDNQYYYSPFTITSSNGIDVTFSCPGNEYCTNNHPPVPFYPPIYNSVLIVGDKTGNRLNVLDLSFSPPINFLSFDFSTSTNHGEGKIEITTFDSYGAAIATIKERASLGDGVGAFVQGYANIASSTLIASATVSVSQEAMAIDNVNTQCIGLEPGQFGIYLVGIIQGARVTQPASHTQIGTASVLYDGVDTLTIDIVMNPGYVIETYSFYAGDNSVENGHNLPPAKNYPGQAKLPLQFTLPCGISKFFALRLHVINPGYFPGKEAAWLGPPNFPDFFGRYILFEHHNGIGFRRGLCCAPLP